MLQLLPQVQPSLDTDYRRRQIEQHGVRNHHAETRQFHLQPLFAKGHLLSTCILPQAHRLNHQKWFLLPWPACPLRLHHQM